MGHGMETSTRAAFLGRPAWHKLGNLVTERLPMPEFLATARMSYSVQKVPSYVIGPDGIGREVPNQFHLIRSDDGIAVDPHTVTKRYQETYPLHWVPELLDFAVREGWGSYDAAFTLYDGQSEVVSVRLDDVSGPIDGDGESVYYLVGQNYHGGSGKLRAKVIRNRVVCHNTVTAGFAGGADMALCHTASLPDKLSRAREIWTTAREAIKLHAANLSKLAKNCNIPDTVDSLLGLTGKNVADIPTRTQNRRDAIIGAASNSPGTNGATFLDVFNGITFLSTHDEGGKGGEDLSSRFGSILDGARGRFEEDSLQKLLILAGS